VALSPLDIQSRLGLAVALRTVPGHAAEARDLLRQLVRDAPEMQAVWNELAWLLATHFDPSLRDATEALRLADQAVSLTHGRDPNALDTRAAALAAAGRFEEAARTARAAEDLAARAGLDSLDREIGERRRLYEAGKAYVQPQPSAQR
jgi:spermidine synthase